MGDGGCAVLSSRFPLAEFGNSEACRKEIKGTRNWATELVSFVGLAPISERTDDEKSCLWASLGFSTMEPVRSIQIGESGEEDYKRRRRHSSAWVEDKDDLSLSVAGPIANPDGPSGELTKSPDQGSTLAACHVGSAPGKKQRVGNEERGKSGVVSNWTKNHLTSGRDIVGESKSDSMNERDRKIGKGHFEINGNVDSRNQHRRNSGRNKYYDVVGGETVRGTSLTGHSGSSHPRKTREGNDKTREGNDKDSGTRSHPREHSTSSSHHASEREIKEKKDCGWNRVDSLHSSSRTGWRGKENGVDLSRCTTASDRHLDKEDVCRHHSERDSYGNRRHHPTRERPYESGSRSGHVESSNHRDSSERLVGRSSCSDKSHSSHRRDYHSRNWSITDKNDIRKKIYDHSGGRNHSGRKNDRHHREQWNWIGHTEDRTNLDEKSADVKGNYLEGSGAAFHSPSVTTCKDDSRSGGMAVPMDLSPAPAHDSAGMCSEFTWLGAVDSGWTEDTGVTSASLYTEASFTGWIYIDYEGNTEGPVELKVLKCLLEDGKLQPDHMVKLDGTNEWVTLEHARSPSASCVADGPLPLRGSEILSQPPQPPDCEGDNRLCSPSVHFGNAGDENQTSSSNISDLPEDCQVDKRVEQLMQGFTLVPGREKEIISEALNHAARHVHLENEQELENEESPQIHSGLAAHWKEDQLISDGHSFGSFGLESQPVKEPAARTGDESGVNTDGIGINSFQSARKWTSRGGDWVLASSIQNFQSTKAQVNSERGLGKEKVVLNGGIPLCESRHSGLPDPRKGSQQFSSLEASKKRAFALPPWAYRFWDVKGQCLETSLCLETSHENSGQVNQPLGITSKILSSTLKSQASTFPVQVITPRGGTHSEGAKKIQAAKVDMDPEQNTESTMKGFSGTEQSQISKGDFAAKYVQLSSTASDISAEQSGKVRVCEDPSVCLATCEIGDSNSQQSRYDGSLPRLDELGGDHAKPLQVSRKEDLRLEEGDWYYKDGAGREMGPFSYAQLQAKVQRGSLHEGSSVYRKSDETWVPISIQSASFLDGSMENVSSHEFCVDCVSKEVEWNTKEDHASHCHDDSCSFQQVYPQFIGYMRGTLHEYVMKSYKNRDFPAMLEGSEKWLNDKQSRTTVEASLALHCPLTVSATDVPTGAVPVASQNSSTRSANVTLESREDMSKTDVKHRESDMSDLMSVALMTTSGFSSVQSFPQPIHALLANDQEHPKNRRAGKRKFLLDIEDVHGKSTCSQGAIHSDLKPCVASPEIYTLNPMAEANNRFPVKTMESAAKQDWGTMEPHLLMKVFSFLEIDVRSLILASATCKTWRVALDQFKREIKEIDLSPLGSLCSDAVFHSFTEHADKLSRVILRGCTMLSSSAVKTFLQEHNSISTVDANGCDQLKEVVRMFPQVSWISSKSKLRHHHGPIESHRKFQSLKLIPERGAFSSFKHVERLDAHSSDDSNCKDGRSNIEDMHSDVAIEPMDCDPPHSLDIDSGTSQITRSNQSTKRAKLSNVGKFAKIGPDGLHHRVVLRECAIVGSHARDKEQMLTPEGKHKQKSVYLVGNPVNAQLPSTEKHALVISKGDSSFAIDRFQNLEKSFAQILKTIKDADTHKIFFRQVSDSKEISYMTGWTSAFSSIEEKVRGGLYQGNKGGLREFKDDLFTSYRKAFRSGKQGTYRKAGQDMFRLTYRLISQLEENLKNPASCKGVSRSKSSKRKHYDHQSGPSLAGRKRETGDLTGKQGSSKRKRGLDEGSADDESEDYFLDKEGRRSYNHKRDYWKESETETSGTDEDDENLFQDEEEEETDDSELEVESQSGEEGGIRGGERDFSEDDVANHEECASRIWGARMTKGSMVPPVTRKYQLIEEYVIVADMTEVNKRMTVNLPDDYNEKLQAAQEKYSHLEMPELKEYRPRKRVQDEVLEQEVYGIDPYTHNLLMDTMPSGRSDFTDARRHQLIEEDLLKALNLEVRQFTGSGKAPNKYLLEPVIERLVQENTDVATRTFCTALLKNMRNRLKDKYVAYRKGLGVVCHHKTGFEKDEFIVEFFGEVYPAWRWFEKQDAIRSLQKKDKDPAPEFYNIFLERPKGDVLGYDLVVVDAMHKANYASRICHSCRPNCEARVTAVNGRYQIGVYTLRPVQYGEELTFDYNSITESKEEYEASVCLCGSQGCRGSYLCFAGPGAFQEVMKDCHGLLHRHDLLLKACMAGHVSRKDWDDLWQAGLGSCLLEGLPDWTIGYAAEVVRFMNNERKSLPKEILKSIIKERCLETYGDSEALEAEIQADGVFNSRVQNLAITLDKVRYAFKTLYGDPKTAPPPLRRLEPTELVSLIWKNENSVVAELLRGMAYHGSKEALLDFKRKVREHEPVESGNVEKNLQESLLWLRDELCKAPTACLSRHDAAADVIHMYAYTKLFFTSQDYAPFESPCLSINHLDLGPKHAHALGTASSLEWSKSYNKDYVLGQLIFWYNQNAADPGSSLVKAQRGCLLLPDLMSCYAKSGQQNPRLGYGNRHRMEMFRRMEQKPQRQWSRQEFWEFKSNRRLFGSPMMDAIWQSTSVNRQMMDWLKKRTLAFVGPWDNQ